MTGTAWQTWRSATARALYGPGGFYRHATGPAAHFRTSVHASPLFARAVHRLAVDSEAATVVDVGSGRGELLIALNRIDPALRLVGVDVVDRPPRLPRDIEWVGSVAEVAPLHEVLVVANEWLDDVPVDVVERTDGGLRVVEVDAAGNERLGPAPSRRDSTWLADWWPLRAVGDRAEIGHPRDDAWADVVRSVRRGVLVAVDYAHDRASRPPPGSMSGYRAGRVVPPVPDGSCDITSHVALDACAAAGVAAGAEQTVLLAQRAALPVLGVTAPPRVAPDLPALAGRGAAAELLDPGGLGGFTWLVQAVGRPVPGPLVAAAQPRTGTEA